MGRVAALVAGCVLALVAPVTPSASAAPTVDAQAALSYGTQGYPMRTLPVEQRPYALGGPVAIEDTGVHDATGVRMFVVGGVQHDHPVAQAQYGLYNLESFRLTGDVRYLDRARSQADRIISGHVARGAAWFFPYDYDFALHQNATTALMRAPWFSAMAQGQALSLFIRLASVTADPVYRDAADAAFESFLLPPDPHLPWVVHVDAARNLWLDEFARYPASTSDLTINGHNFAAYGLYDYALGTGDPRARRLWDGALRTASIVGASGIRHPGWVYNYCLAHGHPSTRYHAVHIDQFLHFHAMTGDPAFARIADDLATDYPSPKVAGTVVLAAGVQHSYAFGSAGRIASDVSLRLPRSTSVTFDQRARILGRGVYYRLTSGVFAGRWVPEQAGVAVAREVVGMTWYLLARRAILPAGRLVGLRVSATGVATRAVVDLPSAVRVVVDARATVRGRLSVRLASGALVSAWVPVASVRVL